MGLKRIFKGIPIGLVSIFILVMSTLIGYLLGGPVGIGTLICAFCTGPIIQVIFDLVKFDATAVKHQKIMETLKVIRGEKG